MWTIDQLKLELNRKLEIRFWAISVQNIHRLERYLMKGQRAQSVLTDQDREASIQNIYVKVAVRLKTSGKQGEATKKFFKGMPIAPQLDAIIQAALQTEHDIWDLPPKPEGQPSALKTADPAIVESPDQSLATLSAQIDESVRAQQDASQAVSQFNSAELFVSVHDSEIHLSNGLSHRSSQTRVYSESAFSYEEKGADGKLHSDEFLSARWSIKLDPKETRASIDRSAALARRTLRVRKPEAGSYAVLVDIDVLAKIFHDFLPHLSASSAYRGLPFKKPGDALVPGAKGDLITLKLDPTLDFGADTAAYSFQGVPQKPLELVRANQIVATAADQQFAHYLGIKPTTARGDLVVSPGKHTYEELLKLRPVVLEILQFSALFTDASSGTFSSEIRLARLHQGGKHEYIKGGSVSGSIFENLTDVRLSSETGYAAEFGGFFATENDGGVGYHGPRYALLNDVSVAS